jgi:hypothetical protein
MHLHANTRPQGVSIDFFKKRFAQTPPGSTLLFPGRKRVAFSPETATSGRFSTKGKHEEDNSYNTSYVSAGDIDKVDGLESLSLTTWVCLAADPLHGNRIMTKQNPSDPFEGFSFAFHGAGLGQLVPSDELQVNLAVSGANGPPLRRCCPGSGGGRRADRAVNAAAETIGPRVSRHLRRATPPGGRAAHPGAPAAGRCGPTAPARHVSSSKPGPCRKLPPERSRSTGRSAANVQTRNWVVIM